ncbi:MAG: hypothetical protein LAP87_11600 [Acidobacteriia bacterium]|nr:hypothetical protein [Terriglobia bacterium]
MFPDHTSGVVLVVEDPFVGTYLRTILRRHGFTVVGAEPQHGIDLVDSGEVKPDLLITNTPGVFARFADQIPVLYLAACPDMELASRFRSCRVLQKPFLPDQLLAAVEDLTGAS